MAVRAGEWDEGMLGSRSIDNGTSGRRCRHCASAQGTGVHLGLPLPWQALSLGTSRNTGVHKMEEGGARTFGSSVTKLARGKWVSLWVPVKNIDAQQEREAGDTGAARGRCLCILSGIRRLWLGKDDSRQREILMLLRWV